jgi:hypothetical protein
MGNSGEGQEKKTEAVANLLRSTSKIYRNADAVRLRISDVSSIPIARSRSLDDTIAFALLTRDRRPLRNGRFI